MIIFVLLYPSLFERLLALEGSERPHILVFVDESDFNLFEGRRHGRNEPLTATFPQQKECPQGVQRVK